LNCKDSGELCSVYWWGFGFVPRFIAGNIFW
jgi:hypothetical protein